MQPNCKKIMHRMEFALIGKQLSHSFSADYFNRKFERLQLPHHYFLLEIATIDTLKEQLAQYPCLRGFNVTIPYKIAIIPFLDMLTPEAAAAGAVNTVLITDNQTLIGHNTDIIGFEKALLQWQTVFRSALIFGTGGAAQAAAFVLKKYKISYYFISRQEKHTPIYLNYSELNSVHFQTADLIINATPVGMYPAVNNCIHINYNYISERHYLLDMIYNPIATPFLRQGAVRGASVQNGLYMLLAQAEAAWDFWHSEVSFIS
jgi:shikimate dehydrogenase